MIAQKIGKFPHGGEFPQKLGKAFLEKEVNIAEHGA